MKVIIHRPTKIKIKCPNETAKLLIKRFGNINYEYASDNDNLKPNKLSPEDIHCFLQKKEFEERITEFLDEIKMLTNQYNKLSEQNESLAKNYIVIRHAFENHIKDSTMTVKGIEITNKNISEEIKKYLDESEEELMKNKEHKKRIKNYVE